MNINQAKYVLEVINEGSFSAAATKLFVTQSALSQAVHAVEQSLGSKIIEKRGGKIRLTTAGELYVDAVKRILNIEEELSRDIRAVQNETTGVIRLGVPGQLCISILPRLLSSFSVEYPSVAFSLTEEGSNKLTKLVLRNELDIAIVRTEQNNPALEYHFLQEEKMCLIAGRGSKMYCNHADGDNVSIAEALDDRFVYLKTGHNARKLQDELSARLNVPFKRFIETDSFEAAKRIAACCSCVMLAPFSMASNEPAALQGAKLLPLTDDIELQNTCLIHSKELKLKKYMNAFITRVESLYNMQELVL